MTAAATVHGAARSHQMSCLEVWGGNAAVDAAVELPGLDVWVHSRPCGGAAAGGDVHYLSSCGTGRITRLLVADVAGHGQEVAATAELLRGLMRRFVNRIEQTDLVAQINHYFTESTDADKFATAVVVTYFSPTAELSLINCGHPPPLWYRRRENRWTLLTDLKLADAYTADEAAASGVTADPGNIPLGIIDWEAYSDIRVAVEPGDLVLMYTDSLPEARVAETGKLLGLDGLLRIVRELEPGDAATLLPRLVDRILSVTGGQGCDDDLTTLLVRATPHRGGASIGRKLAGLRHFLGNVLRGKVREFPWPELTLKNIGGALVPALGRRRAKR